jgi:phenylalanyl-tRNA synthetase beta chain
LANSRIIEARHPSFFKGRTAAVYVGKKRIGVLGEIHPQILNMFQLESPTTAFEIDLDSTSYPAGFF